MRIYDYKKREKTLAVVSEISLDINYAALFHHQPFLNALDIRNGDLTIPLPPVARPGRKRRAETISRTRLFSAGTNRGEPGRRVFCGVRISASGQLIKRENYQPSPQVAPKMRPGGCASCKRSSPCCSVFVIPESAPELQVKFSGDLSQLEDARGSEATLRGGHLVRDDYEARNLFLTTEWKDQTLTIPQCDWSDAAGDFPGRPPGAAPNGRATFQARSTVDLEAIVRQFRSRRDARRSRLPTPPLIEASGSATIGAAEKQVEVVGKIALEKFAYKTIDFEGLTCDFAWDGSARCCVMSGSGTAAASSAPTCSMRLTTSG